MRILNLVFPDNYAFEEEYVSCVEDLFFHPLIQSMGKFRHHQTTNCLEHSLKVSYTSYRLCKVLGWDYRSAARGGLLHDLFLYDYRTAILAEGKHGVVHPKIALHNASSVSKINELEQDIILKHMFPRTLQLPAFKESYLVCMVDKCCALTEFIGLGKLARYQYRCRPLAQRILLIAAAVIKI